MTGFVLRRLVSGMVVIVLTSMFVFALFFMGMGDAPAVNYCEKLGPGKCTPAKLESIQHQMGYDESLAHNYREWVKGVFAGRENVYMDGKLYHCSAPCLGISITSGEPVWTELKQRYPATLTLAIGGAAIYLIGGVTLGAVAARWRGGIADRLVVGTTSVISAIPSYLIILLAWLYLSFKLKVFPTTGYYPITEDPLKTFRYMLLPWLVLGLTGLTDYIRYTRGQMAEALSEDYMRTAQAKGLPMRHRLFKHALRAAILPVITIFGLDLAGLLAGTVFVEQIFGIDGIGYWSLAAVRGTPIDLNVVSASVLVFAVLVVVANLMVDVLQAFLDPRITID